MTKQIEAAAKIRAEQASNNTPYVRVVGDFLLTRLEEHPELAEAILKEGKTIAKSLDAMRKVAEKKKVGNCAVLTDSEGFAVVIGYFESEGPSEPAKQPTDEKPKKTEKPKTDSKPQKPEPETEVDFDFDELLM